MSLAHDNCDGCGAYLRYTVDGKSFSRVIGVEYPYGDPHRYDGISEFRCPYCGRREGRWTGRVLGFSDYEPRYGGEHD